MAKLNFSIVFDVLNDDRDDFPYLVKKYRIDTRYELRHADLSGVDFGDLEVDVLDLTGSILIGANLVDVRCSKLILTDAITTDAALPESRARVGDPSTESIRQSASAVERGLMAVRGFKLQEAHAEEFLPYLRSTRAPALSFYSTVTEQEYISRAVIKHLARNWNFPRKARRTSPVDLRLNFMWLHTRGATAREDNYSSQALDREFIRLIVDSPTKYDELYRGIDSELVARNRQNVLDLQKRIKPDMRGVQRLVVIQFLQGRDIETLFCSGFRPISKTMYDGLRNTLGRGFKIVFLCPSNVERELSELGAARTMVVPNHPFRPNQVVKREDIIALANRIRTATEGAVVIRKDTIEMLCSRVRPITLNDLKKSLVKGIIDAHSILRAGKRVSL